MGYFLFCAALIFIGQCFALLCQAYVIIESIYLDVLKTLMQIILNCLIDKLIDFCK